MDNEAKKTKKKLIAEKEVEVSSNDCTLDSTEEMPGISYEIIGNRVNK